MKILFDMQACQSIGSRSRGIGRYSMALFEHVVLNNVDHECHVLLNGSISGTVHDLCKKFRELIPRENIHVFYPSEPNHELVQDDVLRVEFSRTLKEFVVSQINPDHVHISSLFEGGGDSCVPEAKNSLKNYTVSITLYDIIPYLYPGRYLNNDIALDWYLGKILELKRADRLFSISNAAKEEAIENLRLQNNRVVNISTDADSFFRKKEYSSEFSKTVMTKFGLDRKFILYTGGIDFRKNIESLIEAYSLFDKALLAEYQVAVVCSVTSEAKLRLLEHAKLLGLPEDAVVITGFVTDEELRFFYNRCHLFVFPSIHEGFGLPVLEAMRCGAPVIGSNKSSIPEVIGYKEALFDPHDVVSQSRLLVRALTDNSFRQSLIQNGETQNCVFSWDKTAEYFLEALEQLPPTPADVSSLNRELKSLAYVSPLPPDKSGIATYSEKILCKLARFYNIYLVTNHPKHALPATLRGFKTISEEEFRSNTRLFERVIYNFGNSHFHLNYFSLLEKVPGVVILHDVYLSGGLAYEPDAPEFLEHLYYSHGLQAIKDWVDRFAEFAVKNYPCSRFVLDGSIGVVVNSNHSRSVLNKWFGDEARVSIGVAKLPMDTPASQGEAKPGGTVQNKTTKALVCSFGQIGESKATLEIVEAWNQSQYLQENARLVFVGDGHGSEYEQEVRSAIEKYDLEESVSISGFLPRDDYDSFLAGADIAVQLRSKSHGEASISILDTLSHGIPTVVNELGSFQDLPKSIAKFIGNKIDISELRAALENLLGNLDERQDIAEKAIAYIKENHSVNVVAGTIIDLVEDFYRSGYNHGRNRLFHRFSMEHGQIDDETNRQFASKIYQNESAMFGSKIVIQSIVADETEKAVLNGLLDSATGLNAKLCTLSDCVLVTDLGALGGYFSTKAGVSRSIVMPTHRDIGVLMVLGSPFDIRLVKPFIEANTNFYIAVPDIDTLNEMSWDDGMIDTLYASAGIFVSSDGEPAATSAIRISYQGTQEFKRSVIFLSDIDLKDLLLNDSTPRARFDVYVNYES